MIRSLLVNTGSVVAVAADPITSIFNKDWASVGGWGLFISLAMLIIVGSFREMWVPGVRYRRLEESSIALSKANEILLKQNDELIKSNEITKYFFQKTTPKRGDDPDELV